ncbi:transglycosylase SLT domain-containing protein [Nocardioides solisilvae]|uniref:transglycosylase SLT domain-containing protein n=1 Tax=Nocardioides solisilvae TaxID=1542435 RepID=UPI000D747DD2|nr:transglycosylase SLT domain-containing protein [Nocardioides solisilvae]
MTVADVTGRIAQIQSQLALLAPPRSTGGDFSSLLGQALGDSAVTAAGSSSGLGGLGGPVPVTGAAPVPSTATPGSVSGDDVVAEARKYLGLPYVWGGTDPTKGMDCSGLVQVVYKNLGYDLPRVSFQQAASGRPVESMSQAQPGDLIAWDNSSRNDGVDHIAIYIGGGKMIEAPRTGLDIRVIDVPSTPDVIRRILPDAASGDAVAGGVGGAAPVAGAAAAYGVPAYGAPAATGGTPFADLFTSAGSRYGVSPTLLAAIAKQESGFNPTAVSPAGAQGLMQLMPATAQGLGVTDSFDPSQAVDGAARLVRDLLDRFGRTDLALAAYNAGPGAVLRYDGVPPYAETQNYVRSVMGMLGGAR